MIDDKKLPQNKEEVHLTQPNDTTKPASTNGKRGARGRKGKGTQSNQLPYTHAPSVSVSTTVIPQLGSIRPTEGAVSDGCYVVDWATTQLTTEGELGHGNMKSLDPSKANDDKENHVKSGRL